MLDYGVLKELANVNGRKLSLIYEKQQSEEEDVNVALILFKKSRRKRERETAN